MTMHPSHSTSAIPLFSDRPTAVVLTSWLMMRRELEAGLGSAGLHVASFNMPHEALRYLHQRESWRRSVVPPIAFILDLDFASPDASLAVVKELRQNAGYQRLRSLPILALTTNAQRGKHKMAEEAGVTMTFVRPFRIESLLKALAWYLPGSHGQRSCCAIPTSHAFPAPIER